MTTPCRSILLVSFTLWKSFQLAFLVARTFQVSSHQISTPVFQRWRRNFVAGLTPNANRILPDTGTLIRHLSSSNPTFALSPNAGRTVRNLFL
jgi:hypothetical protein